MNMLKVNDRFCVHSHRPSCTPPVQLVSQMRSNPCRRLITRFEKASGHKVVSKWDRRQY
jgi:hypothetical protein